MTAKKDRWAVVRTEAGRTVRIFDTEAEANAYATERVRRTGDDFAVECRSVRPLKKPRLRSDDERREHMRRAMARYNEKTQQVLFRVNPETEPEVYQKINAVPNKAAYIKGLILEDVRRNG